jgi:hypothetical protein
MKRSAHIYIGEDRIIIAPLGLNNCAWFHGAPVHSLPHSAPVAEILTELDLALPRGQKPNLPIDVKVLTKPLLTASGEKTWHAVCRSFACVDVEETATELVFSPLVPVRGAFSGSGKYWRCDKSNRQKKEVAFRAAAAIAIEEQNLHNPPPLN